MTLTCILQAPSTPIPRADEGTNRTMPARYREGSIRWADSNGLSQIRLVSVRVVSVVCFAPHHVHLQYACNKVIPKSSAAVLVHYSLSSMLHRVSRQQEL